MACTVLYVEDNRSNVALVEHVGARRREVRLLVARRAPCEEAPLDWTVLDALGVLDDDPRGHRPGQLVDLFLTDTAARLAELRGALAGSDMGRLLGGARPPLRRRL